MTCRPTRGDVLRVVWQVVLRVGDVLRVVWQIVLRVDDVPRVMWQIVLRVGDVLRVVWQVVLRGWQGGSFSTASGFHQHEETHSRSSHCLHREFRSFLLLATLSASESPTHYHCITIFTTIIVSKSITFIISIVMMELSS